MGKQPKRVLDFLLKNGSATAMEIRNSCGVSNVADAMMELRNAGWKLLTEERVVTNRYGEKCRIGRYILVQKYPEPFRQPAIKVQIKLPTLKLVG
jgi:hypothetical protein